MEPLDAGPAARDVARRVIRGDLPPEYGAAILFGMWPDCDNATELAQMLTPLEQWEYTLPAHRDREAIRAEMRLLAPDVIHAAELRLAGRHDEQPHAQTVLGMRSEMTFAECRREHVASGFGRFRGSVRGSG